MYTQGFFELPTPAQLRASLADKMTVEELREEFQRYARTRVARQFLHFYNDVLERDTVDDYFERQAVTMGIIDKYVRRNSPHEVRADVSQALHTRSTFSDADQRVRKNGGNGEHVGEGWEAGRRREGLTSITVSIFSLNAFLREAKTNTSVIVFGSLRACAEIDACRDEMHAMAVHCLVLCFRRRRGKSHIRSLLKKGFVFKPHCYLFAAPCQKVKLTDGCRDRLLTSDVTKFDIFEEARLEVLKIMEVGHVRKVSENCFWTIMKSASMSGRRLKQSELHVHLASL